MLERLKRRLGITATDKDALLSDLIEDATQVALNYTGRKVLPDALRSVVVELATGAYNLLGLEGVSSHSEGGVSDSVQLISPAMAAQLNLWRVAKIG